MFAKYLIAALQALGVNAVPVVGVVAADWSVETAILLYLLENLAGIPLAALLVRLLAPARVELPGMRVRKRGEVLQTYLILALGFSFFSLIFITFFVIRNSGGAFDFTGLRGGALTIGLFLVAGFLADLALMRPLSLARGEKILERSLGRIFLLHLAVFLGVFLALFDQRAFFIPFVVLKTIVDLGYLLQAMPWRRAAAPVDEEATSPLLDGVKIKISRKP